MEDFFAECFERYPVLERCKVDISKSCDLLENSFKAGKKLLLCGNGGSAADCGHIAGELLKSFKSKRLVVGNFRHSVGDEIADNLQGALPVISLPDMVAINTAYANDCDPRYNFAQLVYGLGFTGDVLLAISTSGNAKNVNLAATVARAKGMSVVGLTGESGGTLASKCNVCIRVPESETFKVQELHLPVYHTLCLVLERRFFG
ncbi:MAG: SIS domain-containing protein [Puniceicoccales bacterium]|nr:SIS domain-containing protein [Puniceicoccales bacterium]